MPIVIDSSMTTTVDCCVGVVPFVIPWQTVPGFSEEAREYYPTVTTTTPPTVDPPPSATVFWFESSLREFASPFYVNTPDRLDFFTPGSTGGIRTSSGGPRVPTNKGGPGGTSGPTGTTGAGSEPGDTQVVNASFLGTVGYPLGNGSLNLP